MLGRECPNTQEPEAPLADAEAGLHKSALALETPTSYRPARTDETPVETFAAVSAPRLDLSTFLASLWCPRDSSSSKPPSVLISNASPSLGTL